MLSGLFALAKSELGLGSLTINIILSVEISVLFVTPIVFILRFQRNTPGSAFFN